VVKYVKLYEEFNAGEEKAKIAERMKKLKDKMSRRKDAIKKAQKANNPLSAELHKTRLEIDNLDMQKQKQKNNIVNIRSAQEKEKLAKRKQA